MSAPSEHTETIRCMYDEQAAEYARFQEASFQWNYIEKPAFDRYLTNNYLPDLENLYRPDIRVLDLACGSGVIVRHLISRGIRPENIVGVDISRKQLELANQSTPDAAFIQASADALCFAPSSFDLVTCNMALHYLDNQQLDDTVDLIYRILKPGGTFFFVAPDPDNDQETRNPANVNKWLKRPTPWGGEAIWFSRDPYELLLDHFYDRGFDLVAGWPLSVDPEGQIEPELYHKYSTQPSRMAARLQKISDEDFTLRLQNGRLGWADIMIKP